MRHPLISGLLVLAIVSPAGVSPAPGESVSDARIQESILSRLKGLVSIHPERLEVEVGTGTVKLTGSVASLGEKETIARIAGAIRGVVGITNDLTIRPLDRPEAHVAQEVRRHLRRRPKFSGGAIEVTVSGTEVTLEGRVKHASDRIEVAEIAGTVPGVTGIINKLRVDNQEKHSAETIRSRVVSVLGNRVSFGVIRDLEVLVEDSTVTLTGSVRLESDRRQAERLALGVDGVVAVRNLLTVNGS